MESPSLTNLLKSEGRYYFGNYASKSPINYCYEFNSGSGNQKKSFMKYFPSSKSKLNSAFQVFNNQNKFISSENESPFQNSNYYQRSNRTNSVRNSVSKINKEINSSNSISKPTCKNSNPSKTNCNVKLSEFLSKKRKLNIGSVKKNLMHTLQESSNTYTNLNLLDHKTEDFEDIEQMVNFIVSTTKIHSYNREKKEENETECTFKGKESKKKKFINSRNDFCKCKKVGCNKYTCNCLKKGISCNSHCRCVDCKNNKK